MSIYMIQKMNSKHSIFMKIKKVISKHVMSSRIIKIIYVQKKIYST